MQVRTRAVQSQSVNHHQASTLGRDVFLLDIVPPSPYHAADVVHTRSQSYDHRDTVSYHDTVVRLAPSLQPGLVRDCAAPTTISDSPGPALPARRPMTPQSPPPPPPSAPNSLSRDVYHNGLTNAAFIHPDPVGTEYCAAGNNRRVYRPLNAHRMPHSLSVHTPATNNGVSRSPAIPRRRDVDLDDGRRSTTSAGGNRARDDDYVHRHPPPPPTAVSVPATRRQNSAVLVDAAVSRPAELRGPLSLSTGVLNFSPPAPHLSASHVRSLLAVSLSGQR